MSKKMNRRRFLRQGLILGAAAAFFPSLRASGSAEPGSRIQPKKACHYRHLAG